MAFPRLRIANTALLIIDVQERLVTSVADRDRLAHNCAILLRMADALGMPYLVTEHYANGPSRTVEQVASAMTDQSRRIERTRFSAATDLLTEKLLDWRRTSVLVAGIEAHISLLQTVLDLQQGGRQCFVCADAVSSSHPDQAPLAFDRMAAAGAVVTGTASAIYELLEDPKHPAFPVCRELIRMLQ